MKDNNRLVWLAIIGLFLLELESRGCFGNSYKDAAGNLVVNHNQGATGLLLLGLSLYGGVALRTVYLAILGAVERKEVDSKL